MSGLATTGRRDEAGGVRAVVDTSILLPGVFFGGPPRDVLAAWHAGQFEVVVSPEILREYVRVGERLSARFPGADLERVLERIAAKAALVSAPPLPEPVCEDSDDDKFLACAVAAGAGYVVSSDKALLATSPYRNVKVIRSRDLLDMLRVRPLSATDDPDDVIQPVDGIRLADKATP